MVELRRGLTRAIALGSLLCILPVEEGRAWASDAFVSSALSAEGYSVPLRDGRRIRRRRIVEELRLSLWNVLPGSGDPYYDGPRVSGELTLRLDTDLAIGSAEDASLPGLEPLDAQALVAKIDAVGLLKDTLDVSAGRQIRVDSLGFFAFDGALMRLRPPVPVEITAYLGYEVRASSLWGFDALELDGTDSSGRRGVDDGGPGQALAGRRGMMGAELSAGRIGDWEIFAAARTIGLGRRLADSRVGGGGSWGGAPVRLYGAAVYSTLLGTLTEADVTASWTVASKVTLGAEYHRFRPVFEGDSIFNVFDVTPRNDVGARIDLVITENLRTAAWGYVRVNDALAAEDGASWHADVGVGGGWGSTWRSGSEMMTLRLSVDRQWGEMRTGGEWGVWRDFLSRERLRVGLRVSAWHIDDEFSELFSGNFAGYVASVRYRLDHRVEVIGELEHYAGGGHDSRVYAMAVLNVELWR